MIELNIFTNQSPSGSAKYLTDKVKEWLESYLDVIEYEDDDLRDILSLRMVGVTHNGWHCENLMLYPEFIFDRINDDWQHTKSQLLQAKERVFQLLDLIEDGGNYHVFKFSDEYEQELNSIFYAELYELEQMIRSTLTTIFYPKHPDMIYHIAEMYKVDLKSFDADELRQHKKGFQNEFFHLELSSYRTFKSAELLTKKGIVAMSDDYTDLASFIEGVKNLGVLTEEEAALLASVETYLNEIQNFRNCIMHSRAYDSGDIDSFEKAKTSLHKLLLDFQNNDGRKDMRVV